MINPADGEIIIERGTELVVLDITENGELNLKNEVTGETFTLGGDAIENLERVNVNTNIFAQLLTPFLKHKKFQSLAFLILNPCFKIFIP